MTWSSSSQVVAGQRCPSGATGVAIAATLQSKTSLSGLKPQPTVLFRFRAVTKTGQGDWSLPVSFIVQ